MIPKTMKTVDLHDATLVSLKFGSDPLVEETDVFKGKEVLSSNTGAVGALVFVVRRPGCPLVRGDARILQSSVKDGALKGFQMISIVKETGVDNEGLNEFATEYFPYPTYKDQALTYYNAIGSGKLSIGFNPFAMIKMIKDSMTRIKELGVKSYNTKGEGFLQGGWILFDKEGNPQAAFQENAKKRVPIDDILKEVKSMQSGAGSEISDDKES